MDDLDRYVERINEALQEFGPPPQDEDDESDQTALHDGAALTGWMVVMEWMDIDGKRWLSRGVSSSKSAWEAAGMAHEFLYGDW